MPQDGSNNYQYPPGTPGIPDTTIESEAYNTFLDDLVINDLNIPRPIHRGGTGASTADAALVNLKGEKAEQVVTAYLSQLWMPGSFRSAIGAADAPVAGHAFAGICYINEPLVYPPTNANVTVEARDQSDTVVPGKKYIRQKIAGVWSAWAYEDQDVIDIIGTAAPPDSIIVNGDFRINQSAYVSAAALSAGTYGHDQWKAGAGGGNYSFTQLKSSTQITIASGKTLIQPIEDANVSGGSYVLSWTGTAQARAGVNTLTPAGAYAASPLLISGQTAGTVMSVEFNTGTLGTVKLEKGSTATPFVMRPYGQEMATCKRYWNTIYSNARFWAAAGGNIFEASSNFPEMRSAPTVIQGTPAGGSNVVLGSPTVYGNSVVCWVTSTTIGDAYVFGLPTTLNSRL